MEITELDVYDAMKAQSVNAEFQPSCVIINPRDYMRVMGIKHLPRKLKKWIMGSK